MEALQKDKHYTDTDTAPVHVLEGCTISLSDVFEEYRRKR